MLGRTSMFGAAMAAALLVQPSTAVAQDAWVLTVTGTNGAETSFALSDLDAMEQAEFTTSTIWTDEDVAFSGVPLRAILSASEIEGTSLSMIALNDYAVEMPLDEIGDDFPIVATRMDGETMSVRDKGPFWVVYPYDADPEFQTETIYARSIWQLNRLSAVD